MDGPTSVVKNEHPLTETSTVVSPFTPGAPVELSPPDTSDESPDIRKCQEFVKNTCDCHLAHGRPCSDLFSLEHYIQLRAQSNFLTRDELDLTLIGSIMSTVINDNAKQKHLGCKKSVRPIRSNMQAGRRDQKL